MTISTYPTVSVRVPHEIATRINNIAQTRFKGRTSDATRAILNAGIQYHEHYDEFQDPKKRDKAIEAMSASDAANTISVWQKSLTASEFQGLAQIMHTMHTTRHDEKHELQKQLAQQTEELQRLKGAQK